MAPDDTRSGGEISIGRLSATSGLSVDTLRYYERIGLIESVSRHSSGHRRYGQTTAERVESLGYLRATGLGVADMREYMRNLDRGPVAARDQASLLTAHAARIAEQIRDLQLRQAYIEAKAGWWDAAANGRGDSPQAQAFIDTARTLAEKLL